MNKFEWQKKSFWISVSILIFRGLQYYFVKHLTNQSISSSIKLDFVKIQSYVCTINV